MLIRAVRAFLIRLMGALGWRATGEFDDELAAHVDMHVADNIRLGMSPDEARRVALARLGGLQTARQRYQERQGLPALEHLALDIRDAFRTLGHNRGFVAVAFLTIALGMAGPTTMFAMAKQWILDPLPFSEPDNLLDLRNLDRVSGNYGSVSVADFLDWQREATALQDLAAYRFAYARLTGIERAEMVRGADVTPTFFGVLGVQSAAGRTFGPRDGEPGTASVAIISDAMSRRQFTGGDPVGRTIRLDGTDHTIVGVLPPAFLFTLLGAIDVWRPLAFTPAEAANRRQRSIVGLGRLRPGRGVEDARTQLAGIANRLSSAYPETNARRDVRVLRLADEVRLHHDAGIVIPALFAMMVCVLLVACVNVTNVMFARASTRRQEIAVRLAMGASRFRIVRQWLVEHLLVFLTAGAAGVVLTFYGAEWITRSIPAENRQFLRNSGLLTIDFAVLMFGLLVAGLCGLIFGLMPAMMNTRSDVNADLRDSATRTTSGRGASRFRAVLVVSEVALSLALLISAGLLVLTTRNITGVDVGFDPKQLITFGLTLDERQYRNDSDTRLFYDRLLSTLERVDGVSAASAATLVPFGTEGRSAEFFIDGEPETSAGQTPLVALSEVSAQYARTLGLRLESGRFLSEADGADAPRAAMVNEALAARLLPDRNALGLPIRISRSSTDVWRIVGIVRNVKNYESRELDEPQVYVPLSQSPRREATVVLRVTRELDQLSAGIRDAVVKTDPAEPIRDLTTMDERISRFTAPYEIVSAFVAFFGAVTLLLAGVGVYGVVAYSFSRRTREIGIRMSLGATPASAVALVLRQLRTFLLAGVVPGLLLAWLLGQMLKGFLFGVPPNDWRLYLAMTLLLAFVTLVAVVVPARRAASIDPSVALRYE